MQQGVGEPIYQLSIELLLHVLFCTFRPNTPLKETAIQMVYEQEDTGIQEYYEEEKYDH